MSELLDELLSPWVSEERPAIIVPGGETWSYARLDREADRVAGALIAAGLEPGERVGLDLERSPAAIAGMIGTLRAGGVYVPIDPRSPRARTALIADACRMKLRLSELKGGGPAGRATARRSGSDAAYILFTSGSTGVPKGVVTSHDNAMAFVTWAAARIALSPEDRVASVAPLHFDLSVFDVYATLMCGAAMVILDDPSQVSPERLVTAVRELRITTWYSVPSVLSMMLDHGGLEAGGAPSLRAVLFAGEVFPLPHLRRLMHAVGPRARYFNLFGPTETNVCLHHEVRQVPPPEASALPAGRPASGAKVSVARDDGTLVPPTDLASIGELLVEGPTVMLGYLGAAAPALPYRTGDRVSWLPSGELAYHGRNDDLVKVRGFRIALGEVERALHAGPGVAEAAAAAVDGALAAMVVPAVPGDPPSVLSLVKHLSELLPPSMIPETIRFADALPRTSNGKLDRRCLGAILAAGAGNGGDDGSSHP